MERKPKWRVVSDLAEVNGRRIACLFAHYDSTATSVVGQADWDGTRLLVTFESGDPYVLGPRALKRIIQVREGDPGGINADYYVLAGVADKPDDFEEASDASS